MNITKEDFKKLKKAIELLPHEKNFKKLTKEHQEIITSADIVLVNLEKKRKKDNKRQAAYIAEKRKVNKNYAR